MKNVILIVGASVLLAACSSSPSQGNAPLDTQAVTDYQAKVYSGNTVPAQYKSEGGKNRQRMF